MKVRGGKYRGTRLKLEPGRGIRPATNRVKGSVFDILPLDLSGQSVLDLFAGVGSFGIEALSRGALYAVFVDQGRKSEELIKANLKKLGCLSQARVITKKVSTALNQFALEEAKFDLVFIDPPFDQELGARTLAQLSQLEILAPEAIVVVRTSLREHLEEKYGNLQLKDKRKYGESIVSFYLWQADPEPKNSPDSAQI